MCQIDEEVRTALTPCVHVPISPINLSTYRHCPEEHAMESCRLDCVVEDALASCSYSHVNPILWVPEMICGPHERGSTLL